MNKMRILSAILYIGVIMPIWYYLLYHFLLHMQANELLWFLYWVYVPVGIVSGILSKYIVDEDTK